MKVQNELAAKILGEIISEGMNMSGIDLSERIGNEAIAALDEIKTVINNENEKAAIRAIKNIMEKYNIGR